MAQVTGTMSGRITKVEYSTNYSDYTDLSGGANSITVSGGERQIGETWTFDGEYPVVGLGKPTSYEVTIKSLYVDTSVGHFAVLSAMQKAATRMNIRWAYDTDTTGAWRFTAATGYIRQCPPPSTTAEGGDPLTFEWTVSTPSIAEAVIA